MAQRSGVMQALHRAERPPDRFRKLRQVEAGFGGVYRSGCPGGTLSRSEGRLAGGARGGRAGESDGSCGAGGDAFGG